MPRHYSKPPLVEAIAEFQFNPTQAWDWTVPGRYYELLSAGYPKKRQQNVLELTMQPGEGRIRQEVRSGVVRMQFLSEDEKSIVQTGADSLTFNQLPPYPGWEAFRTRIIENIGQYVSLTSPAGIKMACLRYIDRVEIPDNGSIRLEEFFVVPPRVPPEAPQNFSAFAMEVDSRYSSPKMVMRYVFASNPPSVVGPAMLPLPAARPGSLNFVTDIGVWATGEDLPEIAGLQTWLDTAHDRVETLFDKSFTERTHSEVFGEVS